MSLESPRAAPWHQIQKTNCRQGLRTPFQVLSREDIRLTSDSAQAAHLHGGGDLGGPRSP